MDDLRVTLLGAEMDRLTVDSMLDFTAQAVAEKRQAVVANHNLHSLFLYHRDPKMREFYAHADRIEIDSVPLILWGRVMGFPLSRQHRLTYLDFREDFWERAVSEGWRVMHIGGKPGLEDAAVGAIRARHPAVTLEARHGYFNTSGEENAQVLNAIRDFAPDILLVGMGMPRQELWIQANRENLPSCVMFPVGAAFDYEAGAVYTPPRWTGQVGIEWLVRFVHDPKRLFTRYFVEPLFLIPVALRDLASRKDRKQAKPI
ncbi:MAG: WecB/TagA/CpsF family glycosyltransferase [Asticcacaulis sp.]